MKKDLNYIAKIEKAIGKKYGEDAVQNPASNWNPEKEKKYLKQLKEISIKENESGNTEEFGGFLVTKRLINKRQNNTCPICDRLSLNKEDSFYLTKYDCCSRCFVQHVEGREERWQKGWRPNNG
tara:strand:- start:1222 stop:1593 length:372 start_codon:yes stop_codon:yes gene_type:complete